MYQEAYNIGKMCDNHSTKPGRGEKEVRFLHFKRSGVASKADPDKLKCIL